MNQMEAQVTRLNLTILFVSCRTAMHKIIQYLDPASIFALYTSYTSLNALPKTNSITTDWTSLQQKQNIINILASYYYLKQNMLQTDRSFYYSIYESEEFMIIQNQHFIRLTQLDNGFSQLYCRRQQLMKFVRAILREHQADQIVETLQRLADDPDMPMGKLMRQNIGAGCTSTFQQFLVTFDPEEQISLNPELESLNLYFQNRYDNFYVKQFLSLLSPKRQSQQMKVRILRFAPQQITCQNYKNYELPQNQLHNFIISLFLLAEQQICAAQKYIEAIDDPHHRFLELMLRYSLFRNFVISVQVKLLINQEQFGFVFRTYNQLYTDTFADSKMFPDLTFWRSALANWFIKMSHFHQQSQQIYGVYLVKQRQINTVAYLQECQNQKPQKYAQALNQYMMRQQSLQQNQIGQMIQPQMQVLCKEYKDYILDLSIDQMNVHDCGHTKQHVSLPYQEFEKYLLQANQQFIKNSIQTINNPVIQGQILSEDIKFLYQNQLIKSITLDKFIQQSIHIIGNDRVNTQQIKQAIKDMDSKLEYFNAKNQAIIDVNDSNIKAFYQIVSDISVKDILSKSFSTNNTSNVSQMSQQPNLIYESDQEEQNCSNYMEMIIQVQGEQFQSQVYEPPSSNVGNIMGIYGVYNQNSSLMEEQENDFQQIFHRMERQTDFC